MTPFDKLHISPHAPTTLAYQLNQQLTWLIVNGQLKEGDQLPTIHRMADHLGVNLHTVRSAYQKLEANGLVVTRQGRGTHVLPFDLTRFVINQTNLRSHTIGVILPSWKNPFYHAFLEGVEEVAGEDQSMILLCNTHDEPQAAWNQFARLAAKGVDGIIVVSHNMDELLHNHSQANHGIPFLTVDWPGCSGNSVGMDLFSAGYQATKHLLEHGHRRIGLITFTIDTANVTPVNEGYFSALKEAGLNHDPSMIARMPGFDFASGEEAVQQLLAAAEPPTAIFTISDTLAMGALQALNKIGLRVPDDMAIASFNNIPASAMVFPPLTTVAAPAHRLGMAAMHMLKLRIEGEQPDPPQLILPTSLVIRQSCGCR